MLETSRRRATEILASLTLEGLGLISFWKASAEVVGRTLPHYGASCWYTLDPESLLVTSHFSEDIAEIPPEWLAHEYYEDDVNKLDAVARSPRGISTLHEATGGRPESSPRWHENMRYGGDQELVAALRSRSGETWGALGLYREPGSPLFDEEELSFVAGIAPLLADGARRALLLGDAAESETADGPGLIVLDGRWNPEHVTAQADFWIRELPDGDLDSGRLPSAVLSVAGRAMAPASLGAEARVRGRSGSWIILTGMRMGVGEGSRAAVVLQRAHPARIAPLLMAAYGLTPREQEVTRLVLKGEPTVEVARAMHVSAVTVQQHLKSIFEKTGVRSRRDLVGKVFFDHYEPRVRDNEKRAGESRPLRGGPYEG